MNTDSLLNAAGAGADSRPQDRLITSADLAALVRHIAMFYDIGAVENYSQIAVGYEDCNLIIETASGKYVAKLFARSRTALEVNRYLTIMDKIANAGVRHPELMVGSDGSNMVYHSGVWAVLARFIGGKTFYELGRAPNDEERQTIIDEIIKINKIDHKPSYIAGSWIVPKFYDMWTQTRPYFSDEDNKMIEVMAQRYDKIPFDDLERGFIHGDLRTTNVLLGNDKQIYILDYFLANRFIKVQELAIAIATLFYDHDDPRSLEQVCHEVANQHGLLSDHDLKYLTDYTLAAFAMEFMGGTYARHVQKNKSAENTYWLERGKSGLVKYLD